MLLLLAATDAGLGASFFGLFHGESDVLDDLDVPPQWSPLGAVALGWPDDRDRASRSAQRGRRPRSEVVRHGSWSM